MIHELTMRCYTLLGGWEFYDDQPFSIRLGDTLRLLCLLLTGWRPR